MENDGGGWAWRRYRKVEQLAPHAPVTFVNWYEAQAWCNWARRRLPTEVEWEAAALGEPVPDGSRLADTKRRWPWGDASPTPHGQRRLVSAKREKSGRSPSAAASHSASVGSRRLAPLHQACASSTS